MVSPGFVDCHSHVVPSGDDGVATVGEGLELCREAAERNTRLLYATPHVSPQLPLTAARETLVREAFSELARLAPLELRLGYELTPMPSLLEEDPRRYALAELDAVLVEVPFQGGAGLFREVAEHIEKAGLLPVVAHPERTQAVRENVGLASECGERGWLLQVNATSILGYHGPEIEALAWQLIDDGLVSIVASDGHRAARPPYLDAAFEAVHQRIGAAALPLFDGSALGLGATDAGERGPVTTERGRPRVILER